MSKNFVAELRWRGLIHDIMPDTESFLNENVVSGYIGFDPTADSLHIGSLVQIVILMHFQKAGHRPIALVGGATGMIGDPSGKSDERNLLDAPTLEKNCDGIQNQLTRFLDFDPSASNAAVMVNNYNWMKDFSLIDFSRDIGKHLTVNYMMSKDSVKKRLGSDSKVGMSFTEFTYQLLQGYDFLHLYETMDCKIQMGGSDQWGNITTGTELVRRKGGGKAYAITCPLITKADGTKFGKTEGGNIWLDRKRTSPYKFYQEPLEERVAKCNSDYKAVEALIDQIKIETGTFPTQITGGSPSFYPHALRKGNLLSPGTTLLWDLGYHKIWQESPFIPAAVLVTRLISKPNKNTYCFDLGHKAVASEMPLPRVVLLGLEGAVHKGQSEEHLMVEYKAPNAFKIGDLFYALPYHICPTVAKYNQAYTAVKGELGPSWTIEARHYQLES